jgi:SAM-dependent methyltransferase
MAAVLAEGAAVAGTRAPAFRPATRNGDPDARSPPQRPLSLRRVPRTLSTRLSSATPGAVAGGTVSANLARAGAIRDAQPLREATDGGDVETPDIESSAEHYARRFAGSVGAWFLAVQAQATLDVLRSLPARLRILDVGGGHAQLAPVLVDAGHHVTVVGSTRECGARLKPWTRDGRCRFEVGDLQRLPYADRSFDVAISFRILAHVRAPERLIGELCRVAGRSVVVDYPSSRSANVIADRLFALKLKVEADTTRPFDVIAPAAIAGYFGRHGFDVAEMRAQFLLPMALHRALRSAALSRALEAPGAAVGLRRLFGSPIITRADRRMAARS